MGEDGWREYQRERNKAKHERYLEKHPEARKRKKQYATYWRIRKKKELVEYKGGKCEICEYSKDILGAYDFHHIDPSKKEFSISQYTVLNIEKLKKEVDKCMLVCRNCHAEIHDKENRHIRDEAFSFERHKRNILKNKCDCGKMFETRIPTKKFCSRRCSDLNGRKVDRPSKEELDMLIESMPMTKIGERYGVSDNAVRKWAKTYGIKYGKARGMQKPF